MTDKREGENPLIPVMQNLDKIKDVTGATPNGLMARWFRNIMNDLGIGPVKITSLITSYLNVVAHPNDPKAAGDARGSLNQQLSSDSFTFKNFIDGLKVIGAYRIELRITIHFVSGKSSSHYLSSRLMKDEVKEKYAEHLQEENGLTYISDEYLKTLEGQSTNSKGNYYDDVRKRIRKSKRV